VASLMPALLAAPQRAVDIVRAMVALLGTHRSPERGEVDAVILWLIEIAQEAAVTEEPDLLKECCNRAFKWEALWDEWALQREICSGCPF
jgi:hypothetical protein